MAAETPEPWLQHARTVLLAAGLRDSAGRGAVVELLARQRCLLAPQEISDQLRAEGAAGSSATVYRTLETLHGLGLVHRVDAGEGIARYEPADPSGEHHHHLVDEDTGEVLPFEDAELERVVGELGHRLGVEVTGHDVILRVRRPGR